MAFSNTVQTLRRRTALRVRDNWQGSLFEAAATGALTLRDQRRVEVQGYFSNAYIRLGEATAAEDHRLLSNGPQTLTLPVDGGVEIARPVGETYEIHKLWSVPEYNDFISDAIMSVGTEAVLASLDDSSIEVGVSATKPNGIENEYELPDGFRYITEIWLADEVGYYYHQLYPGSRPEQRQVRIIPGATKKLRFSPWATAQMTAGRNIRILGQGIASADGLDDNSVVQIDPDYVISYTEAAVLRPLAGGQSTRAQAAMTRLRYLEPFIEMKRSSGVAEHRALPNSLVVPT